MVSAFLAIALAPLFIVFILIELIKTPFQYVKYRKSRYYKDFKHKYNLSIVYSDEYRFYNSAIKRGLPIQYMKQESNGFEYFVFEGAVYLFPDFEYIRCEDGSGRWQAERNDEWADLWAAFERLKSKLDTEPEMPIRIMITKDSILDDDPDGVQTPDYIFVTGSPENVFSEYVLEEKHG